MKRIGFTSLTALVVCLAGGMLQGQTSYSLTVATGTPVLEGNGGDVKSAVVLASLTQAGCVDDANGKDDEGAQGWSISLTADNLSITSITTSGTDLDSLGFELGFNVTEVTPSVTVPQVGAEECAANGNKGAVSAVVLHLTKANTLGCNTTKSIASLVVEGTVPSEPDPADLLGTLRYADGCQGPGQPVENKVTYRGDTVIPAIGSTNITLHRVFVPPSCCEDPSNVGFSEEKILGSAVKVDPRLKGLGTNCAAAGGEIRTEVAEGDVGTRHAYANISSNDLNNPPVTPVRAVQGWSFSIHMNGDIEMDSATTAGTAFDTYAKGPFDVTLIVDPAKNGGQRGCVSAVVLGLTKAANLPPTGTETVLDMAVKANAPQGAADIVGELKFQSGLVGDGQPVGNALTVAGDTMDACNFATAQVNIVFTLKQIAGPGPQHDFIRGNPNDDRKVDIADAIWIINELFRSGPAARCQDAGDANDSGGVDSADALYLIQYLFRAGPTPPAPFGTCGADPTEDTPGDGDPVNELSCPKSQALNSCP